MARIVKPLSPTEIKNAKPKEKEYTLSDGEGLLLLILPSGSKSWRFNYARPVTGKRTKMALGGYPELSLADARAKREEYRALLAKGIDPQEEKIRIQQEYENRLKDTFHSVAESYFNGIYKEKAKNPETREKNWERLKNHIFPYIGDKHVSEIKVKELVSIYEKIADRSNTLKKIHQLVGAIMDHAITKGIIESHNCRLAVKNFYIKSSTPHPTIKLDELSKLFQDLANARIGTKQQSIHHYKTLQSFDFTEIRAFLFPIRRYKTPCNLRILGVDLVTYSLQKGKNLLLKPHIPLEIWTQSHSALPNQIGRDLFVIQIIRFS